MKIIAGLGNPGPKYDGTRHNIGFAVADALAEKGGVRVSKNMFGAVTGVVRLAGDDAILVKPQTYMNLSGTAVAPIMRYFKAGPSDLIVIHDDLDLPFGGLRIRKTGGDGGHNGVSSVIREIDTANFIRLKVGVGRPAPGINPADHVLSVFMPEELRELQKIISDAVEAVLCIVSEGPDRAMNRINSGATRSGG